MIMPVGGWMWRCWLQELPVMSVRPVLRPPAVAAASGPEALALLTQAPMRCGGCGSKVRSLGWLAGWSWCWPPIC